MKGYWGVLVIPFTHHFTSILIEAQSQDEFVRRVNALPKM